MKHDPLSAISEAEATGETADYFAAIRSTMQLPLLTSIWRTLAGVDGGLPAVWNAARPIFESGFPDLLITTLRNPEVVPIPTDSEKKQLEAIEAPYDVILNIIDTYTRSNSLNLLVLSALLAEPNGNLPKEQSLPGPVPLPDLPALLEQRDIDPTTWQLLLNINQFGATPDQPGLATLWRHLAYWPDVLSVFYDVFAPLQKDGSITGSVSRVLEVARIEGQRLALMRPDSIQMPDPARRMITNYVTHPGLVARMVAIGNGLSLWLQPDKNGY